LDEIALALQDQTSYEHCWLIDPRSGQLAVWTQDGGIDGRTPVELEEVDLLPIEPLPSWVWYQDMADFAEGVSDQRASRSLLRAIQGKGAFDRFKDRLHQNYPDLVPAWHTFQSTRAQRRAIEWLVDQSLIDAQSAAAAVARYRDPDLPEPDSIDPSPHAAGRRRSTVRPSSCSAFQVAMGMACLSLASDVWIRFGTHARAVDVTTQVRPIRSRYACNGSAEAHQEL
jgi:hypothetical protein